MTAPRYVECKCGHARALHPERTEEACVEPGCGCEEYRPVTLDRALAGGVTKLPTARAEKPSAEQTIAAGRSSTAPRIARLADKIAEQITQLRALMEADAEKAIARAEVAELERQLAAAKAKLSSGVNSTRAATPPSDCPTCGKSFSNVGAHRFKAHGWRKEAAS